MLYVCIDVLVVPVVHTGVCEKNTPPEIVKCGKTSFQKAKSGAGKQFLLLVCMAKAHLKGVFFSQTSVVGHTFQQEAAAEAN